MEAIRRAEEQPPVVDGDVGEDGGLRGQGAGAMRPGQRTGETHRMAGVVVALARWPARWKSSEMGSAHTAKGTARALNAASSEPQSMPSSAREKPREVRQKDGRGGAGGWSTTSPALDGKGGKGDAERRLERRLCDGGADPQRGKRSMMLTF